MSGIHKLYLKLVFYSFYNEQGSKTGGPQIYNLIKKEFTRQKYGLELIASENFTSRSVMECLGSVMTNKYSDIYLYF